MPPKKPANKPSLQSLQAENNTLRQELRKTRREMEILQSTQKTTRFLSEKNQTLSSTGQQELTEHNSGFRQICQSIPLPIIISHKSDNSILYSNDFAPPFLGVAPDSLCGKDITSFFMNSTKQGLIRILGNKNSIENYEFEGTKDNGDRFWAALFSQPVLFDDNPCRLNVLFDMTERKEANRKLRRLAAAIEQAAEGIIITDINWIIQYINPDGERISGFEKSEIIGKHLGILKCAEHDTGFYTQIRETLKAGEEWSGRLTIRRKDEQFIEADATGSPVFDESGAIMNYVIVHRDITREAKLERQLQHSQKMEAIGTLAGGVAHDFNNILTGVLGYTELAKLQTQLPPQVKRYLEEIHKAGTRAKELVKQILTFSRRSDYNRRPVQVQYVINEALKLLRATLPTSVEIKFFIDPQCGPIEADITQIHQILMNLCTNSYHSMEGSKGILGVSLHNIDITPDISPEDLAIEPGSYVRLEVTDNGSGMTPEQKTRIFEPYFTTKEMEKGTGMGLAVVHGVIENHNGKVAVYSEPGKGTTFHIYFPRLDQSECLYEIDEKYEEISGRNEHILIIDDEIQIADFLKEMLESLNYQVTAFSQSKQALLEFENNPDKYDMVVTDMTMPEMNGVQLAENIMKKNKKTPIVLCTGFSDLVNEDIAREIGIQSFIMKPILRYELAKTIQRLLNNSVISDQ